MAYCLQGIQERVCIVRLWIAHSVARERRHTSNPATNHSDGVLFATGAIQIAALPTPQQRMASVLVQPIRNFTIQMALHHRVRCSHRHIDVQSAVRDNQSTRPMASNQRPCGKRRHRLDRITSSVQVRHEGNRERLARSRSRIQPQKAVSKSDLVSIGVQDPRASNSTNCHSCMAARSQPRLQVLCMYCQPHLGCARGTTQVCASIGTSG
jgi:hypothetical protein